MANTDSTNTEGSLVRAIWRLELARAKHVLRAYLRTRLQKLEACCAAVLADQLMQTRLSQRELQYAHVRPLTSLIRIFCVHPSKIARYDSWPDNVQVRSCDGTCPVAQR